MSEEDEELFTTFYTFYQQPQLQENCRGSFSAFENDSLSSQQNRAVAGD